MTTETGGLAFPQFVLSNGGAYIEGGMTLRDYFAAKAMQGLITGTSMWRDDEDIQLAKSAYEMADAMLKERGK